MKLVGRFRVREERFDRERNEVRCAWPYPCISSALYWSIAAGLVASLAVVLLYWRDVFGPKEILAGLLASLFIVCWRGLILVRSSDIPSLFLGPNHIQTWVQSGIMNFVVPIGWSWEDIHTVAYSHYRRELFVYRKKSHAVRLIIPAMSVAGEEAFHEILSRVAQINRLTLLYATVDADARRIQRLPFVW